MYTNPHHSAFERLVDSTLCIECKSNVGQAQYLARLGLVYCGFHSPLHSTFTCVWVCVWIHAVYPNHNSELAGGLALALFM